jgi:hypothetical protein
MLAGRLRSAALLRACRAPDPCALLQHGTVPCGGSARGEKTSAGASVVAACILERLPIVTPSLQPWEADYLARARCPRAGCLLTELCRRGSSRSARASSRRTQRHAVLCLAQAHGTHYGRAQELTEPKSEDEAGKVSWTAAPVSGSTDNLKCVPTSSLQAAARPDGGSLPPAQVRAAQGAGVCVSGGSQTRGRPLAVSRGCAPAG